MRRYRKLKIFVAGLAMIAAAATGGGTVFAAGTTMAEITTDKTHDTLSGTEEQTEEEADTSTQVEDRQEETDKDEILAAEPEEDSYGWEEILGDVNAVTMGNGISAYNLREDRTATDRYYDQLDDVSKEIYKTLYDAYKDGSTTSTITLNYSSVWKDQKITITSDNKMVMPDTFHPQVLSWERDMLTPAFLALIYDHPELSWLSGATYYMSYKINGISYYSSELDENNSMVKDVTVPYITTYIKEPSVNATKAEMDTIVSEATESINKKLAGSTSRYQTIKEIHDYICNSTSYAKSNTTSSEYQSAYSAFRDTNGDGTVETVCAGYSRGFKLLCDAYGIPCVLVTGVTDTGGAHMWDLVQMEDGIWYGVDATWDDQTSRTYYDFFLVGSATKPDHFAKTDFGSCHIAEGAWDANGAYEFVYPELSTDLYHEDQDGDGICDLCNAMLDGMSASLAGYSLRLEEETGICFYLRFTNTVLNDSGAYMEFTMPDGSTTQQKVTDAEKQTVNGKQYYVFTCYVAAKEMADDIRAQVFLSDGTACGTIYRYSVQDYAGYMLDRSSAYTAELPVVKAMLNYGTAAQELFGYHTGDLANAILPETERQIGSMDLTALASYQSVQAGNMPDGISYYGSSLVLRSGTLIRHYFTKAGDVELSDITFTLNGDAVTPVSVGSNMFYIEIPAVHIQNITQMNTLAAGESGAITYGVLSYAYTVLSAQTYGSTLEQVMKAMVIYQQAAQTYLAR